jgi:hypothetical protein
MNNYVVYCSFHLENASQLDYNNAFAGLDSLGLKRVVKGSSGSNYFLPGNSVLGVFQDQSSAALGTRVQQLIASAFTARKLKSEIFLLVGSADAVWEFIQTK